MKIHPHPSHAHTYLAISHLPWVIKSFGTSQVQQQAGTQQIYGSVGLQVSCVNPGFVPKSCQCCWWVFFFKFHIILNVFFFVSPSVHNHDMFTFCPTFLMALMAYYLFTVSFILFCWQLFSIFSMSHDRLSSCPAQNVAMAFTNLLLGLL